MYYPARAARKVRRVGKKGIAAVTRTETEESPYSSSDPDQGEFGIPPPDPPTPHPPLGRWARFVRFIFGSGPRPPTAAQQAAAAAAAAPPQVEPPTSPRTLAELAAAAAAEDRARVDSLYYKRIIRVLYEPVRWFTEPGRFWSTLTDLRRGWTDSRARNAQAAAAERQRRAALEAVRGTRFQRFKKAIGAPPPQSPLAAIAPGAHPTHASDKRLLEAAKKRWKALPQVTPRSRRFKRRLAWFQAQLAKRGTPNNLIDHIFSKPERDQLYSLENQPKAIERNPTLYYIQLQNAQHYKDLLASPLWSDFKRTPDLAFKLTLASFGFSVAPIMDPRLADYGEDALRPYDPALEAKKADPLRFLNGYTFRVYEQDCGVRKPNHYFEAYYEKGMKEGPYGDDSGDEIKKIKKIKKRRQGSRREATAQKPTMAEERGFFRDDGSDTDEIYRGAHEGNLRGGYLSDSGEDYYMDLDSDCEFGGLRGGDLPEDALEEYAPDDNDEDADFEGAMNVDTHTSAGEGSKPPVVESSQGLLRGGTAPGYIDTWPFGDVEMGGSETDASPYFVDSVFQEIYAQEIGTDPERAQRWLANDIASTKLGVESTAVQPIWVPLYGYQGVVWFQANVLNSFVDAVDRLLCLDIRAGVTYNLYSLDKREDYDDELIRDNWLAGRDRNGLTVSAKGVGDYTSDHFAWSWAMATLGLRSKDRDSDMGNKILFVAGPDDPIPWTWEPTSEHRVMKVTLSWATDHTQNRPDIAYLRFPENPRTLSWTNQYGSYMAQIARVLTPGRIPNRPGQPAIPDAFFGLENSPNKAVTYGGLSFVPKLWDEIVGKWEENNDAVIYLKAHGYKDKKSSASSSEKRKVSDRWHLYLPGLALPYTAKLDIQTKGQYILHSELGNITSVQDKLLGLLSNFSSSPAADRQVKALEVYLPGTGFFFPWAGPTDLVINLESREEEDLDLAFQPLVDRLTEWREYLEGISDQDIPVENGLSLFPQFLTLRPVYKEYTIRDGDSPGTEMAWNPKRTTADGFRKLAGTFWKEEKVLADGRTRKYQPETAWIGIHQGFQAKGKKPSRTENKPRLLLSPFADEEEWNQIRKLIVDPDVTISLLDASAEPRFGDEDVEQPFGFRYIYSTESALIYRKLDQADLPSHIHHYDYQLNKENATGELVTLSPKEQCNLGERLMPDSELSTISGIGQDFALEISEKEITRIASSRTKNSMSFSSNGPKEAPILTKRALATENALRGGAGRPAKRQRQSQQQQPKKSEPARPPQRKKKSRPVQAKAVNVARSDGTLDEQVFRVYNSRVGIKADYLAKQSGSVTTYPRGPHLRELSYTQPLSVQTQQAIPMNAPPVEPLLNLGSSSLPIVSLSVLTPTEVRKLQTNFTHMRNMLLSRSERCPYEGCAAIVPLRDPQLMKQHLRDVHSNFRCPWCDEPLYEHWPNLHRRAHIQHHLDELDTSGAAAGGGRRRRPGGGGDGGRSRGGEDGDDSGSSSDEGDDAAPAVDPSLPEPQNHRLRAEFRRVQRTHADNVGETQAVAAVRETLVRKQIRANRTHMGRITRLQERALEAALNAQAAGAGAEQRAAVALREEAVARERRRYFQDASKRLIEIAAALLIETQRRTAAAQSAANIRQIAAIDNLGDARFQRAYERARRQHRRVRSAGQRAVADLRQLRIQTRDTYNIAERLLTEAEAQLTQIQADPPAQLEAMTTEFSKQVAAINTEVQNEIDRNPLELRQFSVTNEAADDAALMERLRREAIRINEEVLNLQPGDANNANQPDNGPNNQPADPGNQEQEPGRNQRRSQHQSQRRSQRRRQSQRGLDDPNPDIGPDDEPADPPQEEPEPAPAPEPEDEEAPDQEADDNPLPEPADDGDPEPEPEEQDRPATPDQVIPDLLADSPLTGDGRYRSPILSPSDPRNSARRGRRGARGGGGGGGGSGGGPGPGGDGSPQARRGARGVRGVRRGLLGGRGGGRGDGIAAVAQVGRQPDHSIYYRAGPATVASTAGTIGDRPKRVTRTPARRK